MKIFIIGGASYDTLIHIKQFPKPMSQNIWPDKVVHTLGSTGIGKALALRKLGFDVSFHAMVGDDRYKDMIIKLMNKEHIHFMYDIDPKGTLKHINLLNSEGQRVSIVEQASTFEPLVDELSIKREIDQADLIVVNIINYTRYFLPYIKKMGKPIWVDLHDYDGKNPYMDDYIKYASFIQMSKDNIEYLDDFVKKMNESDVDVLVTHGSRGTTFYQKNGKIIYQEALRTLNVKSTDGAGDHFFSGYLFGVTHNLSIEDALTCGAIVSLACVESDTISNDVISKDWLMNQLQKELH